MTFDSDEWQDPTRFQSQQIPAIVRWTIKYSGGYVRDEKQAEYVLLGLVAFAVVLAILFFQSSRSNTQEESRAVIEKSINATDALR